MSNRKIKVPYAILMGGKHENALLELHDLKFTMALTHEEAFRNMKGRWFGDEESAHIDAYQDISVIDGYEFTDEKSGDPKQKLYFINIGSYQNSKFNEDHHYFFLVGKALAAVKIRAKNLIAAKASNLLPHTDNAIEIDAAVLITEIEGTELHWKKASHRAKTAAPKNGYWPLSKLK